ncbi:MAG: DEAD/DEAH box helicase, partial [Candidatus Moranbacteria bacterium]|nr:DEAD/DEAH box helicase [Candidatus Moranbacteria bacterium]
MKFKFEPNLKYQIDAIDSVVGLFEGAVYTRPEDRIFDVYKNVLKITKEKVLENRDKILKENEIDEDSAKKSDELDFCVEMETGTGKTYVYLRTIFELYKKYGLSKFIITVPSVAIREGVLKTLEITKEHFKNLYNTKAQVIEYDSKKMNKVRGFCFSNHLSIMV